MNLNPYLYVIAVLVIALAISGYTAKSYHDKYYSEKEVSLGWITKAQALSAALVESNSSIDAFKAKTKARESKAVKEVEEAKKTSLGYEELAQALLASTPKTSDPCKSSNDLIDTFLSTGVKRNGN